MSNMMVHWRTADIEVYLEAGEDGLWVGWTKDHHANVVADVSCTNEQLAALFALAVPAVGENDIPGFDAAKLYEIAEPTQHPDGIRIIP